MIRRRAPARHGFPMARVAEKRNRCIVKLNIRRAGLDQRGDFLPVGLDDVSPEFVEVRIMAFEDSLVAAPVHVDQDRGRQRDLRHQPRRALEKREGTDRRARLPFDRPGHPQSRKRLRGAVLVAPHHFRGAVAVRGKTFPAHDQIEPPATPAKFSIGRGLQPRALLHGDDLPNALIFHGAQLGVVVRAQVLVRRLRSQQPFARRIELHRPDEAPNHVCPKRRAFARAGSGFRHSACRHLVPPLKMFRQNCRTFWSEIKAASMAIPSKCVGMIPRCACKYCFCKRGPVTVVVKSTRRSIPIREDSCAISSCHCDARGRQLG